MLRYPLRRGAMAALIALTTAVTAGTLTAASAAAGAPAPVGPPGPAGASARAGSSLPGGAAGAVDQTGSARTAATSAAVAAAKAPGHEEVWWSSITCATGEFRGLRRESRGFLEISGTVTPCEPAPEGAQFAMVEFNHEWSTGLMHGPLRSYQRTGSGFAEPLLSFVFDDVTEAAMCAMLDRKRAIACAKVTRQADGTFTRAPLRTDDPLVTKRFVISGNTGPGEPPCAGCLGEPADTPGGPAD